MKEKLLTRLDDQEDGFVERKLDGIRPRDIRKTVVAFANSVPENKTAVLFIGVSNDGKIVGVKDTDTLQKRLNEVCEDCYPSIPYHMEVLEKAEKHIVAVEISHSKKRPHFSGPAYIRSGSESEKATEQLYEELIATRNSKAYEILKWKDKLVTVLTDGKKLGSPFRAANPGPRHRQEYECRVLACNAHTVILRDIARDIDCSESLDNISLLTDQKRLGRLMLFVR